MLLPLESARQQFSVGLDCRVQAGTPPMAQGVRAASQAKKAQFSSLKSPKEVPVKTTTESRAGTVGRVSCCTGLLGVMHTWLSTERPSA
jgi:hypothetical protein